MSHGRCSIERDGLPMDRELILRKLEALSRFVGRIQTSVPSTGDLLHTDLDAQDIVSVNLQRAVQACVDIALNIIADSQREIPAGMGDTFPVLASMGVLDSALAEHLRKAVGFRNISVHEYEAVDWDIVYAIATERIQDFRDFAGAVLARIDDTDDTTTA